MKDVLRNVSRTKHQDIVVAVCVAVLAFLLASFSSLATVEAAVWYVKTSGLDSNTGTSWEEAFGTIQGAIDASQKRDEIWIQQGTYSLTSPIDVRKGVRLYGGFDGTETERAQRDWINHVTTVDGQDQVYHCFYVRMPAFHYANATIDGFTITRGNASDSGSSTDGSGGGIYNQQSATIIANCTFINNNATAGTFGGGALFVHGMDAPTIMNCAFYGNQAIGETTHGGAIHIASSNPSIINCVFSGNSAGLYGGALLINGNTPAVVNCTFTDNQAMQGGAIYSVNDAEPTITNSIIWGNTVLLGSPLDGPEIYDSSDDVWSEADFSLVQVNYCDVQGGGTTGQSYFSDGSGNISANPQFVDAVSIDLRILSSSPCIDQGDDSAVPADSTDLDEDNDTSEPIPLDIDAGDRIVGTVDMGAHEYQKVWYVDTSVALSGNGMSWAEAFQSIQEAIDAAQTGHEIWVAEGHYLLAEPVIVNKEVDIYGGFDATETTQVQRDWISNLTTVDAQGTATHCFMITETATLDGLIITGGQADGLDPDNKGGGIYIGAPGADILNCILTGNTADLSGGAVYNQGSGTMANCLIYGNSATNGGGIADENAFPAIVNCTISENIATNGGGIWENDSNAAITNTIIWGNSATTGSAFFLSGTSMPVVNHSIVEGAAGQPWFDSGTANLDTDPLFMDGASGDFHLQLTSPCIDAGDNGAVPTDVTVDLDGNPRVGDSDEDGTDTVDMGIYEYTHVPVIWYVDGTVCSSGDGTGWEYAFQTMEEAIDNPYLRNGDEIRVKAGHYTPPLYDGWGHDSWVTGSGLTITKAIKVYGGFPVGMANPQWSDRDWHANATIIDANTQYWYERQRCFYIKGDTNNFNEMGDVVIDGFDITKGRQSSGGGGIFIENSNVTVSNCSIRNNHIRPDAYEYGGGLKVYGPTAAVTILNCTFSGNSAPYGGAIGFIQVPYTEQHHPRIINCTFTENRTMGIDGYVFPVAPTIFQQWAYGAMLEVKNSILWNNATVPSGSEIGFADNSDNINWFNNPGDAIIGYSDIQGGTGQSWFDSASDIDADPLFAATGAWDDNGTTTDTRDDFHVSGDYRTLAASPCVDTGDDTSVPADVNDLDGDENTAEPLPLDLAHEPRFQDTINMGAYEATAAPTGDLNGDGEVNAEDMVELASDFGTDDCGPGTPCNGDIDGDGDSDGTDLAVLAAQI